MKTVNGIAGTNATNATNARKYRAGSVAARMHAHGRVNDAGHTVVSADVSIRYEYTDAGDVARIVGTYMPDDEHGTTYDVGQDDGSVTSIPAGASRIVATPRNARVNTCAVSVAKGEKCPVKHIVAATVEVWDIAAGDILQYRDGAESYRMDKESGGSVLYRKSGRDTGASVVYTIGSRDYVRDADGTMGRTSDIVARVARIASSGIAAFAGIIDEPLKERTYTSPSAEARALIARLEADVAAMARAIASGKLTPENMRKAAARLESAQTELARARGIAATPATDEDEDFNALFA